MILCNECGSTLAEGAKFCQECGVAVAGTSETASQPGRTVANHQPLTPIRDERHRWDREYWQSIGDSESENEIWDAIKNSNDAQKFREYLKAFPRGVFSASAQDRLRKMKEDQTLASLFQCYD
jgi:hypothetical protein